MAKCTACGKFLKPSSGVATCSTCPCLFHKGCVAIPDSASIPKDWVCPECKKKHRKGDNSMTPVKGICETPCASPPIHETVPALSSQPTDVMTLCGDSHVQDLRREFAEYMAEQREFRKEFHSSIAGIIKRMDDFERRLEVIEQREVSSGSREVTELLQTVTHLKLELNDRDQDLLLADLDIGHLPEEQGENVIHTVTVLATKLGIKLDDRDIVFAERVGMVNSSGGGRARRVVVRLARRQLRDDLLLAARVRRNITTADIGLAGQPMRIYINERLTKTYRQLFHRAREACRKLNWKYSWTKRGRIYVRQGDGKQVYILRTEADVRRVFEIESI